MSYPYVPNQAIAESIMRYLGRGIEATLGEIVRYVRNDYGHVSERSVSRYLAALTRHGAVARTGSPTAYMYARAPKLSN